MLPVGDELGESVSATRFSPEDGSITVSLRTKATRLLQLVLVDGAIHAISL